MGESELRTALQNNGETQIRNFWQQAEAKVASRREEINAELLRLRATAERQLQAETSALRSNMLFEAQARAMGCRLHAEAELEERLLRLASQILQELAGHDRITTWNALCEELPRHDWTLVKVHPTDQQLACHNFPAAEVETDEDLCGGLIVANIEDTVRIDNSLRCRLMRAWPDLLPHLLEELRKLVDSHATTHTDTTG